MIITKVGMNNLPLNEKHKRSIYHHRDFQVWQMKQMIGKKVDIFLSHDWPAKISDHGNIDRLMKQKPHFAQEIKTGSLGSPPLQELLEKIENLHTGFAAHLHCKYTAVYHHNNGNTTKFMALDKCGKDRPFLSYIEC
eukprot:UN03252